MIFDPYSIDKQVIPKHNNFYVIIEYISTYSLYYKEEQMCVGLSEKTVEIMFKLPELFFYDDNIVKFENSYEAGLIAET